MVEDSGSRIFPTRVSEPAYTRPATGPVLCHRVLRQDGVSGRMHQPGSLSPSVRSPGIRGWTP